MVIHLQFVASYFLQEALDELAVFAGCVFSVASSSTLCCCSLILHLFSVPHG